MAFGPEELRVLRRALALALHPGPASAEDVQDCHRLAESLDEAAREAARLRAFLVADLGRYRAALPGTAAGYLRLLEEVLGAGYRPVPDDLAALRALRGSPAAAALLERCQTLAEQDVRTRLAGRAAEQSVRVAPVVPASRTRLLALPGGRSAERQGDGEALRAAGTVAAADEPKKKPAEKPAAPAPGPGPVPVNPPAPEPSRRPIPTPGEVFPRRKPAAPPAGAGRRTLAAG
ncbi:hypothetical protein [Streptomyces sp. NPDC006334]|uniref:hypothetical protein n=1 Tax=Streptomyces sp. NPDC006334 TaxID=3156754 RepID=UPI0033A546F5